MNSNFFRSASLFVIVLTGPITSVSLLRSSRPGTSIQYWKKYSLIPFVRLNVFGRRDSVQPGDSCIFLSFESPETGGEAMVSQDWIPAQQNPQFFFLEKSAPLCQSIVLA